MPQHEWAIRWNPSNVDTTPLGPSQSVLIRGVRVLISGIVLYRQDTFGTTRSVHITVDVHISGVSTSKVRFHCSFNFSTDLVIVILSSPIHLIFVHNLSSHHEGDEHFQSM